ncbi:ornithine carbamoyltransferase [Ensifer adhaerens]|uniref:ornithine carbamoyltransferase n=1 Tax=Ensifer canadensis TaxID=555315 RepID=UPI00149070E8|nr:ornithine carbamoyltransferase [Ensifer canadensis]NOV21035.1 ornithine carbamoyltransferase [Ensifer canadensis]
MSINLHGRNVLSVDTLAPGELRFLVQLASDLKVAKRSGSERKQLCNRSLAFLYEQDLPFVRAALEVAACDQGAHVICIGQDQCAKGTPSEIRQMAGMLGRIFDAIECCGLSIDIMTAVAGQAGIPVHNALSQQCDPCQLVADFQTMREFTHKHLSDVTLSVVGNGSVSAARSLAIGAAKVGMDFRLVSPKELWPDQQFIDRAKAEAWKNGGKFTVLEDIAVGVLDADFVYASRWFSHEEDIARNDRAVQLLTPFGVRMATLEATGNPHCKFMRFVPNFVCHQTRKPGADETGSPDASKNVVEAKASIVLDQAENRMHATKAILVATLAR